MIKSLKQKDSSGYITLLTAGYLAALLTMVSGFVAYNLDAHRSVNKARAEIEARLVAEAGLEKAIWSLNQNSAYTGEVASPYGEGEVTIAIQNISSTAKSVTATGYIPSAASPRATKTLKVTITIDTSVVSFNYGVQAGNGGFFMGNNSSIIGSVYANGPIDGTSGNTITGDVYSAGPTGSIRDVNVSGNVHAHTLTNCSVGKDAFYQVKTNCPVTGVSNSGATDPESIPMPINETQMEEWKQAATNGGTTIGNVTINSNATLGPRKIQGNLVINGGVTLTLAGKVWVTGTVIFGNNAHVALSSAYGQGQSELLIATGSITISNNLVNDSSTLGRYVMFISESTSLNSSAPAIDINNNASAAIFYAGNGVIKLHNNAQVKEVTAYKIDMDNNVVLTYDSGLGSTLFESGPGASWAFAKGSYIID